jgi:hypothetical protein
MDEVGEGRVGKHLAAEGRGKNAQKDRRTLNRRQQEQEKGALFILFARE